MVESIPQCNIMEFPKNNPSAITDQNFLESKSKIAWYIGHNLLALLSRLKDPEHTGLPNY